MTAPLATPATEASSTLYFGPWYRRSPFFEKTLEAGCSAPVAAHAELAEGEHGDEIYLRGAVISPDGARAIRLSRTGTPADAAEIGKALAADLLDAGADTMLGSTE